MAQRPIGDMIGIGYVEGESSKESEIIEGQELVNQ